MISAATTPPSGSVRRAMRFAASSALSGNSGSARKASIAAVLHPVETQDLYFVADGTGGHAFAATLDEHNRNVARLREQSHKVDEE